VTGTILEAVLAFMSSSDIKGIRDAVLTAVLISLPQAFFLAVLTAILLDKVDFMRNIRNLLLPVISYAALLNILRYCGINENVAFAVSIFVMFLLMLFLYKNASLKGVLRTLECVILSLFASFLLERSYMLPFFFLSPGAYHKLRTSVFLEFFILLPGRIFELSLVHFLLTRGLHLPKIFKSGKHS